MAFRFTTEVPLRWVDVDSWNVVNNAVYFSLMEQARYEYFAGLGLLQDGQMPFVLAEVNMRYLRPGRAGMRPVVGARVTRLGTKSFAMEYEVRCAGEVLATGTSVQVWAAMGDLRTLEIPAAAREAISAFEGIPPWSEPRAR